MTFTRVLTATLAAASLSAVAAADDEPPAWTGEAGVSFTSTTGNTKSTDVGASLKLAYEGRLWKHQGQLQADYGEANGVDTKDRIYADYQLDRTLSDRSYAFGRSWYEQDNFSGYDSRTYLGGGVGYNFIDNERVTWDVQGGPGVQFDNLREVLDTDDVTVLTASETQENVAVNAGSRYTHQLNEAVDLANDTDVTWTEETTIFTNRTAVTAQLMGDLSARFGFDIYHDTNAPDGAKNTDTTARFALIYTIG